MPKTSSSGIKLRLNKLRASLYVRRSAEVAKIMTTKGRSETVIILY